MCETTEIDRGEHPVSHLTKIKTIGKEGRRTERKDS
jgi:hypothetical protein